MFDGLAQRWWWVGAERWCYNRCSFECSLCWSPVCTRSKPIHLFRYIFSCPSSLGTYPAMDSVSVAAAKPCSAGGTAIALTSWIHAAPGHVRASRATTRRSSDVGSGCWRWSGCHANGLCLGGERDKKMYCVNEWNIPLNFTRLVNLIVIIVLI